MTNYIRACFCLPSQLGINELSGLLEVLAKHNFNELDMPSFNQDIWIEQRMVWRTQVGAVEARLFQLSLGQDKRNMFSFDIDSLLFLPESTIAFNHSENPEFNNYKDALSNVIKLIKPEFGLIDYDADLLCDEALLSSLAAWGNFLTKDLIESFSSKEREILFNTVDEIFPVDSLGVITFIHPLKANQSWSENHEKLDKILRSKVR